MKETRTQLDQLRFAPDRLKLENRLKWRAAAFFGIAGLALVNAFGLLVRGGWGMMVGLGFSQLIAGAAAVAAGQVGPGLLIHLLALAANAGLAGLYLLLGLLAWRRSPWSFAAGMLLYSLDGSIFLLAGDIWSVGVHIFALLWLWRGYRTARRLHRLEQAASLKPAPAAPPLRRQVANPA
jgi:hypothetical protein